MMRPSARRLRVTPKFISPADPGGALDGRARGGQAFFAYCANYLIDLDHAVIVDVEASTAVRPAEVTTAKRMIERIEQRFDLYPERLAGDAAYGSGEMLGWLVHERGIEPHVPVFDKSQRTDGTFSRADFTYDHQGDVYVCPGGKILTCKGTVVNDNQLLYRASKYDCDVCRLKPRCCPNEPARKVPRSMHEGARDLARAIAQTEVYRTSRRQRKKVEMLFAHLKRILRLDRLRLRGPCGAPRGVPPRCDGAEPPQTGETDHPAEAAAGDLRTRRLTTPPTVSAPTAHARPAALGLRVFQRNPAETRRPSAFRLR
jgi:hypothetical protein